MFIHTETKKKYFLSPCVQHFVQCCVVALLYATDCSSLQFYPKLKTLPASYSKALVAYDWGIDRIDIIFEGGVRRSLNLSAEAFVDLIPKTKGKAFI